MEASNSTPNQHDDSASASASAKPRCAIIGSGLAGLVTSYLLQGDDRYNVTVFEQVRFRLDNTDKQSNPPLT